MQREQNRKKTLRNVNMKVKKSIRRKCPSQWNNLHKIMDKEKTRNFQGEKDRLH